MTRGDATAEAPPSPIPDTTLPSPDVLGGDVETQPLLGGDHAAPRPEAGCTAVEIGGASSSVPTAPTPAPGAPGMRMRTPRLSVPRDSSRKRSQSGCCSPRSEAGAPGVQRAAAAMSVAARRALWALEAVVVLVVDYAFLWVFHNPYCGLLFRCGCTWNWAGGWTKCNVHNPTGPRCPWCDAGPKSLWTVEDRTVLALMFVGWATVAVIGARKVAAAPEASKAKLRRRWGVIRAVTPAIVFLLHGLIAGVAFIWGTGYPYFLWMTFEDTQAPSSPIPVNG